MQVNLKELFPIIHIDLVESQAYLNENAKKIFSKVNDIQSIVKKINLNKKVDFCYISTDLYVVNIIRGVRNVYLMFSKIEDENIAFNYLQQNNGVEIGLYQKDVLKEFLEKFLALKKRYGSFSVKFLYLKIKFTMDISLEWRRKYLNNILKYTIGVTRNSDVIGQISENSFGIILTNANSHGANKVVEKILKFINEINLDHQQRFIEVHAALAHEMFILKHSSFSEFIKELDKNNVFFQTGMKLKEIIK